MKRTTALGLAIFFAAAGCATVEVSEVQERWEVSTRIASDEAVIRPLIQAMGAA